VDTTTPGSQFTSPAPSSLEVGGFQVSGSSSDAGSGLSAAQISTDGTKWNALTLAAGNWSYSVDPSSLPNGNNTVYVRAIDQAGNVETPVQLPLTLDGHSPKIAFLCPCCLRARARCRLLRLVWSKECVGGCRRSSQSLAESADQYHLIQPSPIQFALYIECRLEPGVWYSSCHTR